MAPAGSWWNLSPQTRRARCIGGTARAARWATAWRRCWTGGGLEVWREFCVMTRGNQIEKFGLSSISVTSRSIGATRCSAARRQLPREDIGSAVGICRAVRGPDTLTRTRRSAAPRWSPTRCRRTLKNEGGYEKVPHYIRRMVPESTLAPEREVADTIGPPSRKKKGLTYEKDGAWYRATQTGAEKDEVLIRQNGCRPILRQISLTTAMQVGDARL